jgi:hypothetical protein
MASAGHSMDHTPKNPKMYKKNPLRKTVRVK